jgi:hypothetical protein
MSVRVKPFKWERREGSSFSEWEAKTAIGTVLVWQLDGNWWYDLQPYSCEEDGVGEFDTEEEAKQKAFEHYQFLVGDQVEPDDVYDKIGQLAKTIIVEGRDPWISDKLMEMVHEHH